MTERPTGLTVLCIFTLILAGLGFLTWCFAGFGLIVQSSGQQFGIVPPPPDAPEELHQAHEDLIRRSEELQQKWFPVSASLWGLHTVVIGLMLLGGVFGLKMAPRGRKLLFFGMLGGIILELARLYPTIAIQQATMEIMADFMDKQMEQAANQVGGGGKVPPTGAFFDAMGVVAIVMAVGLAAVKMAFYGFGTWYVSQERIKLLFAGSVDRDAFQTAESEWDDEYDDPAS